jgi:hypothetical protein
MMQICYCEVCRTEWATELREHALVMDVVSAIGRDHSEYSDACHIANGLRRVRVRAQDCSDREWKTVTKKAINRLLKTA